MNNTSDIDLSLTFFCSILTLLVFAAAHSAGQNEVRVKKTLLQKNATVSSPSAAWSPVHRRGSYALWREGKLILLDMSTITAGIKSIKLQYQGERGYVSYIRGAEQSPASLRVDLGMNLSSPPENWVKAIVDSGGDCPANVRPFLTVFIPDEPEVIDPIFDFVSRCQIDLRLESLGIAGDMQTGLIALSLNSRAFSGERIFR